MRDCASNEPVSQELANQIETFVSPLLVTLDKRRDKRLVRRFLRTLVAILTFRHSQDGLLLSELGGYILSPDKAPAGTKRLINLLRSSGWSGWIIGRFLWQRASEFIDKQTDKGEPALVWWDESVIEKPESIAVEGLCAVR